LPRAHTSEPVRNTRIFGTSVPIDEVIRFVAKQNFELFVTLAFNDAATPEVTSRSLNREYRIERLREWDARVSRLLVGSSWAKSRLDRPFFFAMPEKSLTHPHWHLLLRFDTYDARKEKHRRLFHDNAAAIWKQLVPRGSTDITPIWSKPGVVNYVAKEWGYELSWSDVILPDFL